MQSALRKIGNSAGITLPKALLREAGLVVGTKVELVAEDGGIMMRAVKEHPRAGWAEDAARIGSEPLSDEERDWLDFANDADINGSW